MDRLGRNLVQSIVTNQEVTALIKENEDLRYYIDDRNLHREQIPYIVSIYHDDSDWFYRYSNGRWMD